MKAGVFGGRGNAYMHSVLRFDKLLSMINVVVFLVGLAVGSFINAYVYRIAVKYKLHDLRFKIKDDRRSYCDHCGKQLHWYENIPVLSWLAQTGKSRCCRKKLPILYPLTEITTAALFLLNFQFSIFNFQTITNYSSFNLQNISVLVVSMAIVGFLVFSAVFDLKYMILPDISTFILIALGVVYRLVWGGYESIYYLLLEMLTGALVGFGFFAILHVATKGKGMGWGDVKLAIFMGAFLGLRNFIVSLYIAFIGGAIVGLVMILVFGKSKKKLIPFGPFLIMATMVSWWWGDVIWQNVGKVLYW